MRTLVLGTLIVIMPFGGMRVICTDSPTEVGPLSARGEHLTDCERLCPLHPSPAPSSSTEDTPDCALSADASALSFFASIAVLRPQQPLQRPVVVAALYSDSSRLHPEPELAHLAPPPKPQAL